MFSSVHLNTIRTYIIKTSKFPSEFLKTGGPNIALSVLILNFVNVRCIYKKQRINEIN